MLFVFELLVFYTCAFMCRALDNMQVRLEYLSL